MSSRSQPNLGANLVICCVPVEPIGDSPHGFGETGRNTGQLAERMVAIGMPRTLSFSGIVCPGKYLFRYSIPSRGTGEESLSRRS